MRRLDELPESERSLLQQLSLGPASVQALSQHTGRANPAVWLDLARLEVAGFVRRDWTGNSAPRPPRIYRLTAVGQRTVEGD